MPGTSSPAPPKGLPEWQVSTEQDDNLSPWALAQAWALIRCSDKFGLDLSDAQIAGQVTKGNGDHPRKQRIQQLRAIFASDPAWYPGKVKPDAQKRGPKPVMTVAKKRAIASADMGLGRAGVEPPVANVVEQAPRATLNPKTKMPFTSRRSTSSKPSDPIASTRALTCRGTTRLRCRTPRPMFRKALRARRALQKRAHTCVSKHDICAANRSTRPTKRSNFQLTIENTASLDAAFAGALGQGRKKPPRNP